MMHEVYWNRKFASLTMLICSTVMINCFVVVVFVVVVFFVCFCLFHACFLFCVLVSGSDVGGWWG
jgi:hypothetical protein